MTVFLLVLCAIFWTIIILAFGVYAGRLSIERYNEAVEGPPGPMGPQGPPGPRGFDGPDGPSGKCEHSEDIADLKYTTEDLRGRMSRLERRAGFSV